VNKQLPGFGAAASLATKSGCYVGGPIQRAGVGEVVPQLQVQGGLGYGNVCYAVCRCCQTRGNYFCCEHCRWCSWPVASSGLLL
jgi:hypothetical protein